MFVREFIQALSGNDMHEVGQILSEAVSDEKHSAFNVQHSVVPWSMVRGLLFAKATPRGARMSDRVKASLTRRRKEVKAERAKSREQKSEVAGHRAKTGMRSDGEAPCYPLSVIG